MPAERILDSEDSGDLWRRPVPQLLPERSAARGFRIRIELLHADPPVWRKIEVPGDITLPRLHDVIQAAMGWMDSHLHQFRASDAHDGPVFLTQFDVDEGYEGLLEDDIPLNRVVAVEGDTLWYDYDFGDGWEHALMVDKVLDSTPSTPTCISGEYACPPEDCGGIGGHHQLSVWVRSDYDDAHLPPVFNNSFAARAWLPRGWHPDEFEVNEANDRIFVAITEPPPLVDDLASILEQPQSYGARMLSRTLSHPAIHKPTEICADAAAELTEPFRALLDVIGDGKELTNHGRLRPADVTQIASLSGLTDWWIGKSNREDSTRPVATLRAMAQSMGLVSVRKGRIVPTQATRRAVGDPSAILRHIASRLPLGKSDADRDAGWATLAVVAIETPEDQWFDSISSLLFDLGWRDPRDPYQLPSAISPTLDVLRLLGGSMRNGWLPKGSHPNLAAFARSIIRA